ncbi:MAG: glycosyltransferase family 2 protein [Candidatus Competibacteraceae bacterium]|nr:glycosyltransferase family 2 protein [Candidatus Competibacteraceae bacterium]
MSIYAFFRRRPRIENPKVIMTLLVRDEIDIIERHLRYHTGSGIDGLIVTDHQSQDGTREILEQYRKTGAILELIDEPSPAYDQVAWVHRMIERARDHYGADYCINSDADEFWYAKGGSLRSELVRSRVSKIKCPSYNMLPPAEGGFWTATDCVQRGIPKRFPLDGFNVLFHKPTHKVIHRTQGYCRITPGNHGVGMADDISERSRTIRLYHYNIRSREQFKRKMLQGGAAMEANINSGEKEGSHWRHFYRGYQAGLIDFDEEFDKVIGRRQLAELRRLGCVVTDPTMRDIFATL